MPDGLRSALTGSAAAKPVEAVVGVHIDPFSIRVAVVSNSILVLHKTYPRPEGVAVSDIKFAPVLRTILDETCARHRRVDLWVASSFPDSHLHHVRIPRVPTARIMSAVRWAVNSDRSYDEKTTILDMDVEGDVVEEGTSKTAVTAYTIPRATVLGVQDVFRSAGHPLTGITLPVFALRNLFKSLWIAPTDETILHMHVSFNYSRFSIISKGSIILTRGIKTGFNALLDAVCDGEGKAVSKTLAFELLSSLEAGRTASGAGENVLEMIQPVLLRIVRQIEQTIAAQITRQKAGEYNQSAGEYKTLYISGEICRYRRMIEYIQEDVGIDIQVINPLTSSPGSLAESDTEAAAFSTVVGLALSAAARTPNALLTREEGLLVKKSDHFVRIALAVLVVLVLGMVVAARVIYVQAAKKNAEITRLQSKLDAAGPTFDTKTVADMTAKFAAQRERMERMTRKTEVVSVLGELSRWTPAQIQLTEVTLDMDPPESVGTRPASGSKVHANVLIIKGRVRGGHESPDSVVAAYAVELDKSPIFDEVAVQQRSTDADVSKGLEFVMNVVLANRK